MRVNKFDTLEDLKFHCGHGTYLFKTSDIGFRIVLFSSGKDAKILFHGDNNLDSNSVYFREIGFDNWNLLDNQRGPFYIGRLNVEAVLIDECKSFNVLFDFNKERFGVIPSKIGE